jgi:hypothetical protein
MRTAVVVGSILAAICAGGRIEYAFWEGDLDRLVGWSGVALGLVVIAAGAALKL